MRTISSTLLTAQGADSRTPYIKMLFTSKDGLTTKDFSSDSGVYGDRILSIDHQEEAYNEYAVVLLSNDDTLVPDITGYWTEIGYGLTTGSGNEYSGTQTSRLWVKYQRPVSIAGRVFTMLELEGCWKVARENPILLGNEPEYKKDYSTDTIYSIIGYILAELAMTVDALGGVDDLIINTLTPNFTINSQPYENARGILYRLIRLTKCYLRCQMGLAFKVVYPQSGDAVVITYNRDSAPYFYSVIDRQPSLVPNHFYVFGNAGTDGLWTSIVTGSAVSQPDIDKYRDTPNLAIAPAFTTQDQCNLLASARLLRARAEQNTGVITVPHDGRVELYDKVAAVDNFPASPVTYPSNSLTRVGGLHHIYQPGKYDLEIYLGGVSNTAPAAEYEITGRFRGTVNEPAKPTIPIAASPSVLPSLGIPYTPPPINMSTAKVTAPYRPMSIPKLSDLTPIDKSTSPAPTTPKKPWWQFLSKDIWK